jgi:hypothetical protein
MRWDVAAGTFSLAAVPWMPMHNATPTIRVTLNPCDTTVAPGPSPPGPGKKAVIGGLIAGGAAVGVAAALMMGKSTTTRPATTGGGVTTQGVNTAAPTTYQSPGALLTVTTVVAGSLMTNGALSTPGQSTEWQRMLLAVVVEAAPR